MSPRSRVSILLAIVRGDVLAQQMKDTHSVIQFGDEQAETAPTHNSFYDETVALLRWAMALLAMAMELGAGLALYDARRYGRESGEIQRDSKPSCKRLAS